MTGDINARRARELADEAQNYYARHGEPLDSRLLPDLLERLEELQSRRTALGAESGRTAIPCSVLSSHAQPIAFIAVLLLICSFAIGFFLPGSRRERPLARTITHASQFSPVPQTPFRPTSVPNETARTPMPVPSTVRTIEPEMTAPVYDRLRNFVQKHVSAESARELDLVVADYFETVDYFDDGKLDRIRLRADKETYFKRWPRGNETINGTIQLTKIAVGEWHATFPTKFRVENDSGEWIEGDATNDYEIEFIDDRPLITAQKVNVTGRQKGSTTSVAGAFGDTAMTEFVTQLQRNEMSLNLDTIMKDYAPRVDYFDHGKVDHAFIRRDKEEYFHRWPKLQYEVAGNVQHRLISPGHHQVTFPLSFRVENPAGEWIVGTAENTMNLIEVSGQLKIFGEKSKMIHREKGVNTPLANSSDASIPMVATARRYDGRGRVFKTPELRDLVGRKLKNAWYYGDLLFRGWTNNTGHFITTAVIILPKEGNTDVDVEFAGGIAISQQVQVTLSDPMLVVPVTLHAADPVELLSVTQQSNGRLRVRARYHGRLEL